MPGGVQVLLYDQGDKVAAFTFEKTIELGRQIKSSEVLYTYQANAGPVADRIVVARLTEDSVSKRHARLEPTSAGGVRITNLSRVQPIRLEVPLARHIDPGESRDVALPQLLRLGTWCVVRLQEPSAPEEQSITSLAGATLPPGVTRSTRFPALSEQGPISVQHLVGWFAQAMDLFQLVASAEEFFDRAALAAVEMVGLDVARVLMLNEGEWQPRAVRTATFLPASSPRRPSLTLLSRLLQRKAACFETPGNLLVPAESMTGLEALVAAPILDREGEVIGAIYGERQQRPGPRATAPIGQLDAMLIEMLARALAAGLSRLRPEAEARNALQLLEQFFTPDMARYLVGKPDWEKWHHKPITLLFCDVCSFSRIIGKLSALGAQDLISTWCRDVLNVLSAGVLERNGVLIDYMGDGLLAMWGAPADQPDHAARACEAALHMLEGLEDLNERWQDRLGQIEEQTDVHIGINTGMAQVGNIGSQYKFKYGALGDPVNIASRVQTANRYFKSRMLISASTRNDPNVRDRFLTRRLGWARLKNIKDPVELFELSSTGRADQPAWKEEYEKALELFEQQRFRPAARLLAERREQNQEDGPVLVLLSRIVNAMVEGAAAEHPVWRLADK
jgi:adenylate cyclase